MSPIRSVAVLSLLAGGVVSPALAQFSAGNLVVMSVNNANPTGSGAVTLSEYTTGGSLIGAPLAIDSTSADGVSIPSVTNHDRHLHRSADGRYLTFVAYGALPGAADPSTLSSATTPRVVGLVGSDRSVNLSTRLNSFDVTSVRGAYTTNGSDIWVAGDNAGGAVVTGGLRYTTLGSTSSVNLSQVQAQGGPQTPDNIRDLNAFGGQLYNCSGSGSSVGKAVFQVGSGMPTSGSQTLMTLTTDNVSQSSFYMLDLDPSVPGMDTMYTAAEGIRKYVLSGGSWVSRGLYTFSGIDQVIASVNPGGSVTVYAANTSGVIALTDSTPLTGTLSGSAGATPAYIISAPSGSTLGGIEFSPVPAPGALGLLCCALPLAARRRRR